MKSVKFKKIDNKYNETEDQATETNRKETNNAMVEFSPLRKLKRLQSKQFKSKSEEEIENIDIDKDSIINELKAGNYFGEISCLNPKMTATASVECVNFITCATISRTKIENSELDVLKYALIKNIYKYKDKLFMLCHKFITNIPEFSELSNNSIRSICLKLKREEYSKHSIIIRFGQIDNCCYFIERGSAMVYVWNEITKTAYPFQKIYSGGCFNFINSLIGYSSIFIIRSCEKCKVLKINFDDLKKLSKKDKDLKYAISKAQSSYMIYGNKYDFIYKLFNTDNKQKRVKRKNFNTFCERLKFKKNSEISELRISMNQANV